MQKYLKASAILVLGVLGGCATDEDRGRHSDHPSAEHATHDRGIRTVTAEQAADLIANHRDVVVLDIRTPAEFASGHIAGAININSAAADRDEQLAALDKSKTYVMH